MLTLDYQEDVNIQFFNGSSWSGLIELCTKSGQTAGRCMDVCYESVTGDLLIAYWVDTSNKIGYRTYSGGSVSGQSFLDVPTINTGIWIRLVSDPTNNDIHLFMLNSSGILYSCKWNGSGFGSVETLESSVSSSSYECFAAACEANSGTGLVAYGEASSNYVKYRVWTGSAWGSEQTGPNVGAIPRWVQLAADPNSDAIMCAVLDSNEDINAAAWNGSSWGSVHELETSACWTQCRAMDVAYEPQGTKALIIYSDSWDNRVRYRTWGGSAWSGESWGPDLGDTPVIHQLRPGKSGSEIFAAVHDNGSDVNVFQWNGSGFSSNTQLETDMSNAWGKECFMLSAPALPVLTPANIPYRHDFESAMGAEWSTTTRDATSDFTTFAGRHRTMPLKLALNTTVGETYRIAFDFYTIDSWDGTNTGGRSGPDYFKVGVNGTAVFSNTFTHEYPSHGMTYPYPYDQMGHYGYQSGMKDAIFRKVEVVFTAYNAVSKISFYAELVDPSSAGYEDESWGIDNITVQSARFRDATSTKGFAVNTCTSAGTSGAGLHWADLDNDGDLDCLITGNTAKYLKNTSAGTSFTTTTFAFTSFQRQAALLDIDNDGDIDIWDTAINSNDTEGCVLNNGSGVFSDAGTLGFSGGETNEACAAGDINRDGFCDLAMFSADGNWTILHQGGSTPTLVGSVASSVGMNTAGDYGNGEYCSSGDINNDGCPDFFYYYGDTKLFLSNGDGSYTRSNHDISMTTGTSVKCGSAWADLDNDGDLDLIAPRKDEGCSSYFWRNDRNWTAGTGAFTNATSTAGFNLNTPLAYAGDFHGTRSVATGDYDNDGHVDVLLVGTNGGHYLYKNDGDGTFTRMNEGLVAAGTFIDGCFVDYDNDGDLDIALTRENGNAVLFENRIGGTNYLKVRLIGRGQGGTNKAGIGTRVELWNAAGTQCLGRRDVGNARGFGGTEPLWLHFGGVTSTATYKLKVYWASRGATDPYMADVVPVSTTTTIGSTAIRQMVTVTEPSKSKVIQWTEVRNKAP